MQRWTAQLALVAYLLGGWIIPATHGAGSHSACSHQVSAVADQGTPQGDSAEPQQHACCESGCGWAAYRAAQCLTDDAPGSPESGQQAALTWQAASGCHDHHGLCAICVAQNHASPNVQLTIELPACDVVQWFALASSQRLATVAVGAALSRGPPAV